MTQFKFLGEHYSQLSFTQFIIFKRVLLFFAYAVSSISSFFLFTPEKGIRFVQEGQYTQAVSLFTEAIKCDPKDYR